MKKNLDKMTLNSNFPRTVNPNPRIYEPDLAEAITQSGRDHMAKILQDIGVLTEVVEYAGFRYRIIDGRAVPEPGQHQAANKEKHRRAALEQSMRASNAGDDLLPPL